MKIVQQIAAAWRCMWRGTERANVAQQHLPPLRHRAVLHLAAELAPRHGIDADHLAHALLCHPQAAQILAELTIALDDERRAGRGNSGEMSEPMVVLK